MRDMELVNNSINLIYNKTRQIFKDPIRSFQVHIMSSKTALTNDFWGELSIDSEEPVLKEVGPLRIWLKK